MTLAPRRRLTSVFSVIPPSGRGCRLEPMPLAPELSLES